MNLGEKFKALVESEAGSSRTLALAKLESIGFPADRSEDWKYTKPSILLKRLLDLEPKLGKVSAAINFLEGCFLVEIADGKVTSTLDQKFLSVIKPSNIACEPSCSWTALNLAIVPEILQIKLTQGEVLTKPIQIVCESAETSLSNHRLRIEAASNSEATIIINLIGGKESLVNIVLEGNIAENAHINCIFIQENAASCYTVNTVNINLESSAQFKTCSINLGSQINRNNISIVIDGEGSDAQLFGLSLLNDIQHVDNHTMIDHAKAHSTSTEIYKGVYSQKSCGVFDGTIIVRPDAQKTNAIQSNQAILLSDSATSNAKPQLKIWADDVKCTHGATVGQIDANSLFYLQSRGISKTDARKILINAFAAEILEQIKFEPLKEYLLKAIEVKLNCCQ